MQASIKSFWPAIALLVTVVWLLVTALVGLGHPPDLGVRSLPLEDGSQRLAWVMPAGYSWDAGLRPGDRISRVSLPSDSLDLAAFELISENQSSSIVFLKYPWSGMTNSLLAILGLEFLAAGILIYAKALDRSISRLLILLLGTGGIAQVATTALIVTGQPWVFYLEWISDKTATAAFAYFFCTVPVPRCKTMVRPLLWALFLLVPWYTYAVLVDPSMYSIIKPIGFAYMAICLGVGALALAWPFLTRAPKEQRRLWPIALCAGISTVAFIGSSLVPYLLFGRYIINPEISILSWALLPIGFVWAILSYRVLGVALGPWALLHTILDSVTDPIFVVGRDGQLVNSSRPGLALLGITKVSQTREPFEELLRRSGCAVTIETTEGSVVTRVLAGEIVRDEEESVRLQDGSTAYFSVTGTPIHDEQGVVGLAVLIYRDITRRKQAEEELRKAREGLEIRVGERTAELARANEDLRIEIAERKQMQEQLLRAQRLEMAGRIAGQVAHDFNNLLAPLVGYPELMKKQLPAGHPAVKYCEFIQGAARQMATINEDLLTLGRRGHFNQEVLVIDRLIEQAIERMSLAPETLSIELDFTADILPIKGSPAQLGRVITNLVSNAREAMEDIGVLRIKTENVYVDKPFGRYDTVKIGEYVRVEVEDTAGGIPEAVRGQIFDAFFTTKRADRRHGSGLGLAVVQAIISDHRGYLDVESEVGKGSKFSFYLPACREALKESNGEVRGGRESILVVDDDEGQRELAKSMLESLGYKVSVVDSGEIAVSLVRDYSADLMMLDMVMPGGIDGAETFRRVLDVRPGQRAIILSGFAESERVREAQALGAGAFVRKPVTLSKLAQAVREALERE